MKRFGKQFLISLLILLAIATVLCLAACDDADSERDPLVEYDNEYDWDYNRIFMKECDDYMKIDGVLDESVWTDTDRKWLTYEQYGVKVSYSTYFSDKGLYIAAIAEDPEMQWNGRMCFNRRSERALNSAFFFAVAGSDTTALNMNTRFYFALDSKDKASYEVTPFDAKATTDVDIDSGNATKMWGEVFCTWEDLRMEGKPESVCILPYYHFIKDPEEEKENKWVNTLFADYTRFHTYTTFDSDGYAGGTSADSYWGNAASGYAATTGWDVTEDKTATSNKGHSQAAFVTDVSSAYYKFGVDMKLVEGMKGVDGSDGYFRAGVCAMTSAEDFLGMVIESDGIKDNYVDLYSLTNSPWNWTKYDRVTFGADYDWEENDYTVHWDVVKYGAYFYYFIDGSYVGYIHHEDLEGACTPGIYTLSSIATFSDPVVEDCSDKQSELYAELEEELYFVDAPASVSGGTVIVSCPVFNKSDSDNTVEVTVNPNPGYVLNTFLVNGVDMMDYVKSGLTKDGTFTLPVNESMEISATFVRFDKKYDVVTIRGEALLPDGVTRAPAAKVVAYDVNNPFFSYTVTANSTGKFEVKFLKPQDAPYDIDGTEHVAGNKWHVAVFFDGSYMPVQRDVTMADAEGSDVIMQKFVSEGKLEQIGGLASSTTFHEDGSLTVTSDKIVTAGLQISDSDVVGKNWTLETTFLTEDIATWNAYGLFVKFADGSYRMFGASYRAGSLNAFRIIMWDGSGYQGTLNPVSSAAIDNVLATYMNQDLLTMKVKYQNGTYTFYLNDAVYCTGTAVTLGIVDKDEPVELGFGVRLDDNLPQGMTFTEWGYTVDGDSTYVKPGLDPDDPLTSLNWQGEQYSWLKNSDGSYTFTSGIQKIATGLMDTSVDIEGKKWIAEINVKTSEITAWNSYGFMLQLSDDDYVVIAISQRSATDKKALGIDIVQAPEWKFGMFSKTESTELTSVIDNCLNKATVNLKLAFDGENYSVYINNVLYGTMSPEALGVAHHKYHPDDETVLDASSPKSIGIGLRMDDGLPTHMTFSGYDCYVEGSEEYDTAKESLGL